MDHNLNDRPASKLSCHFTPPLTSSSMYHRQYVLNYQQQMQQQQYIPQQQSSNPSFGMDSTMSTDDNSSRDFPETHKSMWAINHLCISERGKSPTRPNVPMC